MSDFIERWKQRSAQVHQEFEKSQAWRRAWDLSWKFYFVPDWDQITQKLLVDGHDLADVQSAREMAKKREEKDRQKWPRIR